MKAVYAELQILGPPHPHSPAPQPLTSQPLTSQIPTKPPGSQALPGHQLQGTQGRRGPRPPPTETAQCLPHQQGARPPQQPESPQETQERELQVGVILP